MLQKVNPTISNDPLGPFENRQHFQRTRTAKGLPVDNSEPGFQQKTCVYNLLVRNLLWGITPKTGERTIFNEHENYPSLAER